MTNQAMGPTTSPAPSASNLQYLPDGTAVQGTGDLRDDAGELPNGDGEGVVVPGAITVNGKVQQKYSRCR